MGDLTYTYDAVGQRTTVGGTFARTGLPQALASATYDAGNRIATWGGQIFSYDANGNLGSDGLTSYVWNTRNQLTGLSGAASASFAYDAKGQRRARTTSGTTSYLYDGANAAQELVGGTATANVMTGGIDEVFQRTDGAGTRAVLTDALGSTVALVDGAGAIQTQYTYEPFGATSTSGGASTNPTQFTGRENDNTNLYYYRARYYDPKLGRFLSEDPVMWRESPNLYPYVENNPVNFTDPSGEAPVKNNANRAIPFKPENEDGTIKLCMPGQTCDADGVYPPACDKYPVKIVDGCTAEVTPDGRLIINCPIFLAHPEKSGFLRHFPYGGQAATGGPTNQQFHKDHPDWPPPNNKPNCGRKQ